MQLTSASHKITMSLINGNITADELIETYRVTDKSLPSVNGNARNKYEGLRQVRRREETFNQSSVGQPLPINRFNQSSIGQPLSLNRFNQSSDAEPLSLDRFNQSSLYPNRFNESPDAESLQSLHPQSSSSKASGLLKGRQTIYKSMAFYPSASKEFELALDTESLYSSVFEEAEDFEPPTRNRPDPRSRRLLKRHSIAECWTTTRLPEIEFQSNSRVTSRNSCPEPLSELSLRNQGSVLTKPNRRLSLTHSERNFESLPAIDSTCRKENNFSNNKSKQLSFHLTKAEQDYDRNKSKADVLLHWLNTQQPC